MAPANGIAQAQPQPVSVALPVQQSSAGTTPPWRLVLQRGRISYDLASVADRRERARLLRNREYARLREQRRIQVRDAMAAENQDLRQRLRVVRESVEEARITLPPRAVAALAVPASSVAQSAGQTAGSSSPAAGAPAPTARPARVAVPRPAPVAVPRPAPVAVPRPAPVAVPRPAPGAPVARSRPAPGAPAARASQSVRAASAPRAAQSSTAASAPSLPAASVWPANSVPQPHPMAFFWPGTGSAWPVLSPPMMPPSSYALSVQPWVCAPQQPVVSGQSVLRNLQVAMNRATAVLSAPRAAAVLTPSVPAARVSAPPAPSVAQAAPVTAPPAPSVAQAAPVTALTWVDPPPVPVDDSYVVMPVESVPVASADQGHAHSVFALDDGEDVLAHWVDMDVSMDDCKL